MIMRTSSGNMLQPSIFGGTWNIVTLQLTTVFAYDSWVDVGDKVCGSASWGAIIANVPTLQSYITKWCGKAHGSMCYQWFLVRCPHGGFHFLSILDRDFPWNKPSIWEYSQCMETPGYFCLSTINFLEGERTWPDLFNPCHQHDASSRSF